MTSNVYENDLMDQMTFEPLTRDNWGKFIQLFGEKGACGNCWCMWPRLNKKDFTEGKVDDGNKNAMRDLVWAGQPAGILGFIDETPVAWCAFAPREHYLKLENSRVHKRIDDQPVWSIPCFFVHKKFRRAGISVAMLKGIIQYARDNNISVIEAYPAIPTQKRLPDSFAWIGLLRSFEKAGFTIVDQTSRNRPMVRYYTGMDVK